jgi:hypothetical protein
MFDIRFDAPHAIFVLTILGLILCWYEEQNFTQL